MNKKLYMLLCALLLVSLFASCSDSASDSQTDVQSTEAQTTEAETTTPPEPLPDYEGYDFRFGVRGDEGKNIFWGVGIHEDIILASVNALVSALNRQNRKDHFVE